jgi:tetratricopeptide (TPR) repeat protein
MICALRETDLVRACVDAVRAASEVVDTQSALSSLTVLSSDVSTPTFNPPFTPVSRNLAVLAKCMPQRHAGMVFVADDLAAWLISVLADAGRKKLIKFVLGTDQDRALRRAATDALKLTASELRPESSERAEELALVVSQVFGEPALMAPPAGYQTVLEALQAGITGQLAVLDDASLTGTGLSSADVLSVPPGMLAQKLTGHLVRAIVVDGARGGPLAPLAAQLNNDAIQLQGQRIEGVVAQLATEIRDALARMDSDRAPMAPVTPSQLPPVTAAFTGRDGELALLVELLDPDQTAGPIVVSAVAGLAGVGKTTLAVAAGHAALRHGWFRGGVLFVDLHGYDEAPVEPGQAIDGLLRALGVAADQIPPDPEGRTVLYRSVLAQIPNSVLIIADNASSETQIRPLLPGAGSHKVLVTSRHTLAGLNARLVDLTVMDEDASVGLLDRALRLARPNDDRVTGDRGAAARLVRMCSGLPLALQIAAALLKADPTLTTADLAGQLAIEHTRLDRLAYEDGGGVGRPTIAIAFGLSYDKLDDLAKRIFRLLAVNGGPDVSTAAAAVLADLPADEVRRVLARLAQAHLIEPTPGPLGRWRMHDLLHLYSQRLSAIYAKADSREDALHRLLTFYVLRAESARIYLWGEPYEELTDVIRNDLGWERDLARYYSGASEAARLRNRELRDSMLSITSSAEARGWLDAEQTNLIAAVGMAERVGRYRDAVRLTEMLTSYFSLPSRFDDWITSRTVGHADVYRSPDRLDDLLKELRPRLDEAINDIKKAIINLQGSHDRDNQAMALNNLGLALREARRFDEAITAFKNAIGIFRETGDRHREGLALNSLGLALQEAGRFKEAVAAFRNAAAAFRETGDQRGEDRALRNLETLRPWDYA